MLDVSEFKHHRINHSKLFADKQNHINGIENFWNQAKRRLRGYNGIPKQHFHLFINRVRMALQLPTHRAYAGNPDPLVAQVIQVTLSIKSPFLK